MVHSVKLTYPLKIGRAPKGNETVFQPVIFGCENVNFREGTAIKLPIPYPYNPQSMYGIFTYIYLLFMVNVGKYTIHGFYGTEQGTLGIEMASPPVLKHILSYSHLGSKWGDFFSARFSKGLIINIHHSIHIYIYIMMYLMYRIC